jgi:hypothetical protein
MLELATLPPYLCGWWSLRDPDADSRVFSAIRRIVFDEMSHLGLACNLLTTIGGVPRLADPRTVPKYPGPLPGGVRPGLTVFLSGLTKESLDMYSRIEEPDDPVAEARMHTSVGAFYTAILEAFSNHTDLITGARQVTRGMSHHGAGNSIVALPSLAAVQGAIGVIKEQGEGTSASPHNPHPGQAAELAHYYVFRELYHGRELVKTSTAPEKWEFKGAAIPMPATMPMGTVPRDGWGSESGQPPDPITRQLLDRANHHYSAMLRFLEQAWQTDVPSEAKQRLQAAVDEMRLLGDPAQELMGRQLPDGSGKTYGPEFRYVTT